MLCLLMLTFNVYGNNIALLSRGRLAPVVSCIIQVYSCVTGGPLCLPGFGTLWLLFLVCLPSESPSSRVAVHLAAQSQGAIVEVPSPIRCENKPGLRRQTWEAQAIAECIYSHTHTQTLLTHLIWRHTHTHTCSPLTHRGSALLYSVRYNGSPPSALHTYSPWWTGATGLRVMFLLLSGRGFRECSLYKPPWAVTLNHWYVQSIGESSFNLQLKVTESPSSTHL